MLVTLGSEVDFLDEETHRLTTVRLVMPAAANIALGQISILTPMGAALYGLTPEQSIDWPDRAGNKRRIRIIRVAQRPNGEAAN